MRACASVRFTITLAVVGVIGPPPNPETVGPFSAVVKVLDMESLKSLSSDASTSYSVAGIRSIKVKCKGVEEVVRTSGPLHVVAP